MPVPAAPGPHPEPLFEQPAGPQRLPPVPLDPLAVLGVDGFQPPVAEELIDRLPGDPAPLGRVLEHLPLGGGDPGDLRAALHEGAVPLLAAPQRLLGGRPGGARDHDQPGPAQRAVGPVDAEPVEDPLAWLRAAARRARGEGLQRRASLGEHLLQCDLGPGGVHRGPDLGHRPAGEVRHRAAEQLRQRGVDPDESHVGAENRHPGGRVTQDGIREPGFELCQSGLPLLRHRGVSAQRAPRPLCRRLPLAAPSCSALPAAPHFAARRLAAVAPAGRLGAARTAFIQNKRATIQDAMLPANCTEAKRESPPTLITRASAVRGPGFWSATAVTQNRDTDEITASTGHNDDSMGRFSYSGWKCSLSLTATHCGLRGEALRPHVQN